MTKAEAIAMLKRIQEPEAWEPQINQVAFEAFDMAIEALSQESSEDVISRQAAIKAIEDLQDCYNGFSDTYDKACIIGALEELACIDAVPVVRCRDCKFCKKYYHGAESNLGMFTYECIRGLYTVTADEFCSKAERKEE